MAERKFKRVQLIGHTHVQMVFDLGNPSRSGPADVSVTLPVEEARDLVKHLEEALAELGRQGRQ